jgi:hypothetical protein
VGAEGGGWGQELFLDGVGGGDQGGGWGASFLDDAALRRERAVVVQEGAVPVPIRRLAVRVRADSRNLTHNLTYA